MTVLEPGPGMGFFTIELARRIGRRGRVIAVDIQRRMLAALKRRVAKAGVADRVEARMAAPDSLGIADVAGQVDFVLAFAMVHELPSAASFFREAAQAMKPGASLLLAEPTGHVKAPDFDSELKLAAEAGLRVCERPVIRGNHAALLRKD